MIFDVGDLRLILFPFYLCSLYVFHSNQLRQCQIPCVRAFMYIYDGIIPQVPVITDGWALAYFCHLDLAFFPARVILEISDLGNKRAWLLDDIFLGFRSAQSPLNIQAPAEKKWSSRMRSELHGDLKLVSPLMAGVYGEISANLELPLYPGHI